MPLEHSASPAALHRNMHTLFQDIGQSPHVQSRKQAIAIALETQRRARAGHFSGGVAGRDMGGGLPFMGQAGQMLPGVGAPPLGVLNNMATGMTPGMPNQGAPSSPAMTMATSPPGAMGISGLKPPASGIMPSAMLKHGGLASGGINISREGIDVTKGQLPHQQWFTRRPLHIGPVMSAVPGRTDNHKVQVPAGSYVLPAAHVSSLGHGNTLAGMSIADKIFGGPYGAGIPHLPHGHLPHPPSPFYRFANGGYSEGGARGTNQFQPVDVDISGGEYVIPPWAIIKKFGSLKAGHEFLDKWIMDTRKKEIETQKKLPPPAKRWMGGGVGLELALAA